MVLVANDYYDFNPSPATWAVLLTGIVLFVLALSLLLIFGVGRGQASGPVPGARPEPADQAAEQAPDQQPHKVEVPATKAS